LYGRPRYLRSLDRCHPPLGRFAGIYSPAVGNDLVIDYLGQTGLEAMNGTDILKVSHGKYSSGVEYSDTGIAKKLKGIANVHLADLETRIFYCDQARFDTHAKQLGTHATLWKEVSEAVDEFFAGLREHDAADNVVMLMFTEFGRRARDNGSGTDHGSGGVTFTIGDPVKGGQYGEYPATKRKTCSRETWSLAWTSVACIPGCWRTGRQTHS